jgi:predicted ABC-type ATPase
MASPAPSVVMIGGPNGAGKSTAAGSLLRDTLTVTEFVNADVIARGLSGFRPDASAVAAGRVMLDRLRALADKRIDFAFETTMASRSFAPWLRALAGRGYQVHLVFLWLPTPDLAVQRVRERVRSGGHDVPEETIRRRFGRGMLNFLHLYRPLARTWRVYDNSRDTGPVQLASGRGLTTEKILDEERWRAFRASAGDPEETADDRGDDG